MTTDPPDLSDMFFIRWADMCSRLNVDPFDLLRVAYSESGCRASAHNPNGHASGLIQFMPATLTGLGWVKGHESFRALDAAEQVSWVERYMRPHAAWCHSAGLCYVAVFLPALGPKASTAGSRYVLCGREGPLAWAYNANRVLDKDGDGTITVDDLAKQLASQCHGARWEMILWRLRQSMGLQPPTIPPPPETLPELPNPPSDPMLPLLNTPMLPPDNAASSPTTGPEPIIHPLHYNAGDDPPDEPA